MHNKWVFSCKSPVDLIQKKIQLEGNIRGYKASLARAARCQSAYFSQVLRNKALLTPEQAVGLSQFWIFNDMETEYFVTLVEIARAGSQALVSTLQKRLLLIKEQREISESQKLTPMPSQPEKALHYYLDWTISAVHILLSIPNNNDVRTIAKRLSIDESLVFKALNILQDLGIAEQSADQWTLTSKNLHATQETLFASLHHRNWRDKSIEKLMIESSKQNLHYTSVVSLSKDDFQNIRKLIGNYILEIQKTVQYSEEQILSCMTIDWFEI